MRQLTCLITLLCLSLPLAAAPTQRPNILLLMAEDMSARVGAFGDSVAQTPNLDQLAAGGVRYPNTFTAAGVCAPSRAAHILGMYQISTGTQHMRTTRGPHGTYQSVPPEAAKAYPELLRRAGYFTWTDRKLDYQFSGPMSGSGPFTVWDEEGGEGFSSWRNREDGQPFYGFINFAVTHESGIFPPLGKWPRSTMHFVMQVMRAFKLPDAPDLPTTDPDKVVLPPYFPDTPTVRTDMARHYNNIAVMDWQVGEILKALEADGLADSTIVIWTTDHGDGLPRSKREIFDSGIRVPMIIRWPEAFRPKGVPVGGIEERLVSFVDFAPTLLQIAGVDVPDNMQGTDFVEGQPRRYIYAARDRIDEVPDRQRAVRDERYKYIRSWHPQHGGGHPLKFRDNIDMVREMRAMYEAGELNAAQRQWFEAPGKERLFDLATDPFELNNLIDDPAHGPVATRMRQALNAWLGRGGDWSDSSEADMIAGFQLDGETRVTPAPQLSRANGTVQARAANNASIGYRVDDGRWQLYNGPVTVPAGATIEARAVRYGWRESEAVSLSLN